MSLTSLTFLGVFFPLILIAYYNPFFRSNSFRKVLLLLSSLALYSLCEPIYITLLLGLTIVNYCLVELAEKLKKDLFRGIAIVIDAGVLLFFKYINSLLAVLAVSSTSNIIFPIGLSYYTFKAISYVVDSKKTTKGNFIDVAIYITNFLTIVSGPLSTYSDELGSISEKKQITYDSFYCGVERIIIGLAKKMIIADNLGVLVKQCFSANELSLTMAWAGAIAYTFQLFFDFSGYTDIAIGVGKLLGFNLPENFNFPYMAESISDFWKRWHISLTKWFTKYLYISLGGSRVKSVGRHIFNLFVVWLVTGLWHGSTPTFLIWAMVYFLLQLLEKYTKWADILKKLHLGHVYTMLVVVIEWVIFRAESVEYALMYTKSMFLLNGNSLVTNSDLETILRYAIPFILGIIFSTNIGKKVKGILGGQFLFDHLYNLVLFLLFIVCIILSISQGYSSPLYAGF